jgi:tetratricopeptide (TPR) repeat protein
MKRHSSLIWALALAGTTAITAVATPLDDRIAAFAKAQPQNEQAVLAVLEEGIREGRSAQAFATVAAWLDTHPVTNQSLLFTAGRSAEYAGEWSVAVSFYRQVVESPKPDQRLVAEATPALYRLLLGPLGQPDTAYLFMRDHGDRLRNTGAARRYDDWFLATAKARGDVASVCARLAAMCRDGATELAARRDDFEWVCEKLETFPFADDALLGAASKLASEPNLPAPFKERLNWVIAIAPFTKEATELSQANKPIPDSLRAKPLAAAQALIAALPMEGSILAARGWMAYGGRHTPSVWNYIASGREGKAAPILEALATLSPQQAHDVLTAKGCPRGRPVSFLFLPAELRALVAKAPALFNTLAAADVPLVDPKITVDEAKALAPHLARNPHRDAAVIRAIATAGSLEFPAITAAMPSEMWRFAEPQAAIDAAKQVSAAKDKKEDRDAQQALSKPDPRVSKIEAAVGKKASTQDRTAAFQALSQDLLGAAPTIPRALALWDRLFSTAPDAEAAALLAGLAKNAGGDSGSLFRRAAAVANLGGHVLYTQAALTDYHLNNADQRRRFVTAAAPVVAALQPHLAAQAQAGRLSEYPFAIWLHAADPKDPATRDFMRQLAASPAYAALPQAYRNAASDSLHFGGIAFTAAQRAVAPWALSEPRLSLQENAPPEAVEAAFEAAIQRVAVAPQPVALIGVGRVAGVPAWSPKLRSLAFTLFREHSPVAGYPADAGYQQLVERICREFSDAKQWQAIESYSAGLWLAAASLDYGKPPQAAAALTSLAESALESGNPSAALTLARDGLRGAFGRSIAQSTDPNQQARLGQLRRISSKAGLALGASEIPVDESNPAYPIFKSAAEFAQGNLEAAWNLYVDHADVLPQALRKLSPDYAFWLLARCVSEGRAADGESLIKELSLWSREVPGLLSAEQDARLKIAYADVSFLRGGYPTARAWYRKVADAAEFKNTEMHLLAGLGSARVDRITKNFSAALTELDKLAGLGNPDFGLRIRYARAEVLMDQENFKEALDEIAAVLRQEPKHPDALLLQGKIQTAMRKLIEASEIPLGPSQTDTVLVPGESVKINLRDPTLGVSGVAAEIEVEVRAKSGDREFVLLAPFGDSREQLRGELATALGPPTPGDKKLQVLGNDEIRFGYSPRFRAKMRDLPPDPDTVIGVAADARLGISAGGFPSLDGERRLSIEELGVSSAQAKLGFRSVRPGNPVYLRVIDADQSTTPAPDTVTVTLEATSGDAVRSLVLTETGPFTGVFEGVVPTAPSQALAFASENAPGRDAIMAISPGNQAGWQGKSGDPEAVRTFGVDLNDDVPLSVMTFQSPAGQTPTHFLVQTSQNGRDWVTRSRNRGTADPAPFDGRPQVTSFPTFGTGAMGIAVPKGRDLPLEWREKMDVLATRASVNFLATTVPNLSAKPFPVVVCSHPGYSALVRFSAVFYQQESAIRRFQVTGWPANDDKGVPQTFFLIDGQPAPTDSADALTIERELAPGLHTIEVWRHASRSTFETATPVLLCDAEGKQELVACPDSMFDPKTFPAAVRSDLPLPAVVSSRAGALDVAFATGTRARLVRLVIVGFSGVAPAIERVTLTDATGKKRLPVAEDAVALRNNQQLEVLPGDTITARYIDPVPATPKRTRHEGRLTVAYDTAKMTASFLNYKETPTGRELLLEPIRRFGYGAAIGIVIDDADMDTTDELDVIDFTIKKPDGTTVTMKAVETEVHSGRFIGRVFPVEGTPARESEIQVAKGGSLTATYRDMENLDPGVPATRSVTILHARYQTPVLAGYAVTAAPIEAPVSPSTPAAKATSATRGRTAAEIPIRQALTYSHVSESKLSPEGLPAVLGAPVRVDVVVPHLAFAQSSTVHAFVQTEAARQAAKAAGTPPKSTFDITLPGTLKLAATLDRPDVVPPPGYTLTGPPHPPTGKPPLDEGRFAVAVPLILGDPPTRSFADKAAEALPISAIPQGLAVKAGDVVHVGFPWKDEQGTVAWKTVSFTVGSHTFLDVLSGDASATLAAAYVGERIVVRLVAPGLDRGPECDRAEVSLSTGSGAATPLALRETEPHSGIFIGGFTTAYVDGDAPSADATASLESQGLPVRYGDTVTITSGDQARTVAINKGADGLIEPFTKRYGGDQMAVRTAFTLAECFLELAKKHAERGEESLARREIDHAEKLLAEALANRRDPDIQAQAEYLLGNLAQEFANLAKNDESRRPRYQQALKRFSEIPLEYPDTEFASKAQYKTAQTYEKLGEAESAVEEYVKLAYKYPGDELIPSVMSRLGDYFQKKGQMLKEKADAIRDKADSASRGEVIVLDEASYPEFLKAARVFEKLHERFPEDPLAPLAGLRAGQNYMRAHQYDRAVKSFEKLIDVESYDGPTLRAQAMYWGAYARELWPVPEGNWKARGDLMGTAYKFYRRITFEYPDSIWAKRARGRLADPAFASIAAQDADARQKMIDALEEARKNKR